ncbi:uncharacterized protein METZ01_LOCUS478227, partial [marine metagenome]
EYTTKKVIILIMSKKLSNYLKNLDDN